MENNLIETDSVEKISNSECHKKNQLSLCNENGIPLQESKGCAVKGCKGFGNINKNYNNDYKGKYCALKKQSQATLQNFISTEFNETEAGCSRKITNRESFTNKRKKRVYSKFRKSILIILIKFLLLK